MEDPAAPNLKNLQAAEFTLQDGCHEATSTYTGVTTRTWIKDEKLHKEDGPAQIEIDEDGEVILEEWYLEGQVCRKDGGPSIVEYCEGDKVEETWCIGKIKHRENGPAVIRTDPDTDEVTREEWYINDALHRNDGPAEIIREKGVITSEAWWEDAHPHKEGAPALIHRDSNTGAVTNESWFRLGKLHREEAPAVTGFFDDYYEEKYDKYKTTGGQSWLRALEYLNGGEPFYPEKFTVWKEEWWVDGRLHREDGPAILIFNKETGKKYLEKWYLNGKLHRENDPAWVVYDVNTDQVIEEKFYKKGRKT